MCDASIRKFTEIDWNVIGIFILYLKLNSVMMLHFENENIPIILYVVNNHKDSYLNRKSLFEF